LAGVDFGKSRGVDIGGPKAEFCATAMVEKNAIQLINPPSFGNEFRIG